MADNKDPNNNSDELTKQENSNTTSELENTEVVTCSAPANNTDKSDYNSDDTGDENEDINHGNIEQVNIVEELKSSYLDYAMSVIMGRALPDARDGFKPVHRRVIYAMRVGGYLPNVGYSKSAEIVGKVMGQFHPHGDSAIYDTLVRMGQDWSLRYPLVDPNGNFGGRGDESPAAMRYTEARMRKIAMEMVRDIFEDTVDLIPNYSNKDKEPVVLPTRFPNLLVNGSNGIAVGMATNIPPHNLAEVINGCLAYVDNPDISIDELIEYIPAPDFPTGCTILFKEGIKEAYHTGRGKLYLRSVYSIKEDKQHNSIVNITEIPYQISYNRIVERIQELIKSGEVEGIIELLNLSKSDINIQLKIHRDFDPRVVMNHLFNKTQLQTSISFNMLALSNGKPELLNLKQFIQIFVDFRREVITRRCVFNLRKSRERIHTLEALSVALTNIDEIIHIIRNSSTSKEAQQKLMARGWKYNILETLLSDIGFTVDPKATRLDGLDECYGINQAEGLYYFSPAQAESILSMTLSRLTGLEINNISDEYKKVIKQIIELIEILSNSDKLNEVLSNELIAIREKYGDERRSPISDAQVQPSELDYVTKEEVVITITRDSYIKCQSLSEFHSQNRGGRGRKTANIREEDIVENFVVANSIDNILMFTNFGRVYSIPAYKLPNDKVQSRGRGLANFVPLIAGEKIVTLLAVSEQDKESTKGKYLVFATEKGLIKKTPFDQFLKIRQNGIICFRLNRNNMLTSLYGIPTLDPEEPDLTAGVDRLAQVCIGTNEDNIYMVSANGMVNSFGVNKIKSTSRRSMGVLGMKLQSSDDLIIGMIVANKNSTDTICTITASGFAKRTDLNLIPLRKSRGGSGVKVHKLNSKVAKAVMAITQLADEDQVVIITSKGKMLRANATQIRNLNRISQGVLTIRLEKDEEIVDIERIVDGVKIETEYNSDVESDEILEDSDIIDTTNIDISELEEELDESEEDDVEDEEILDLDDEEELEDDSEE